MMSKLRILVAVIVLLGAVQVNAKGPIYLFSPKYFGTSFNSEIGLTFFTGFIRSPMLTEAYELGTSEAYPIPITTWAYPITTVSYEPQFRLIELGSANSISINIPLAASLSIVDAVDPDGRRYDPSPEEDDFWGGFFGDPSRRNVSLGTGHVEFGGLVSYNLGQNATVENTWPIGVNLAGGMNFIYAPLLFADGEIRSEYSELFYWSHVVGRVGLQFGRFGFNHMFGLNPQSILYYRNESVTPRYETARTYHRFAMTFQIGK